MKTDTFSEFLFTILYQN